MHVATQRGRVQRLQHRHPPRAQPVAPMPERHGRRPRLPPRSCPELALAEVEAAFRDGQECSDASDATPGNVAPTVKLLYPRVALTRAKARCLRPALNRGMVALEELGEE